MIIAVSAMIAFAPPVIFRTPMKPARLVKPGQLAVKRTTNLLFPLSWWSAMVWALRNHFRYKSLCASAMAQIMR